MPLDRHTWEYIASQALKAAEISGRLIVTGAAGTLVLSVTFVHEIAPTPVHWTLFVLVVSWLSLLVALFAALRSLHTTERALHCVLKEDTAGEEKWNDRTDCWNAAATWTLVFGIGLFALFAIANLLKKG